MELFELCLSQLIIHKNKVIQKSQQEQMDKSSVRVTQYPNLEITAFYLNNQINRDLSQMSCPFPHHQIGFL